VLLFLGCAMDTDDTEDYEDTIAGVDSKSYDTAGSYSIRITNESNRDLIVFKSSLSTTNILGAVPKQANDHGLKSNATLFPSGLSQDFTIVFLTREDYEQYKDNLSRYEQYCFTRIFVAYNAGGANNTPWIVSGRLGGENKLVINNFTSWGMELRENSPWGATLIFAPYEAVTTLHISGDMYVFPVFKKYNAMRDEIITIYPLDADENPMRDKLSFGDSNELTIDAKKYIGNTDLSGFYLQ
jgi:hypothetical protein